MEQTTFNDDTKVAILSSGQILYAVHKSTMCRGEVCPIHNPSSHVLSEFPLIFNAEIGSFFRKVGDDIHVDPDDYIFNQSGKVIIRNSARCLECHIDVVSHHRHDFATCECGGISVDGGSAYLRRVGDNFIDTSVIVRKQDSSV